MGSFSESVRGGASDLLARTCAHPVLAQLTDGKLPDERFRRWMGQIYLFGRESERFVSVLLARSPREIRRPFSEAMMNTYDDMDIFEEIAKRAGVDTSDLRMTFACHSYVNFLFTVVHLHSFGEALSAAYGALYAPYVFWSEVKKVHPAPLKWQEFVDIWSGEGFAGWIAAHSRAMDSVPGAMPAGLIDRTGEAFRISVHYHLRFLDMVLEDHDW